VLGWWAVRSRPPRLGETAPPAHLTLLAVGVHGCAPAPRRVLLGAYAGQELRLVGATVPLPAEPSLPLTVYAGPRTVPGWLLGGLPGQHAEPAAYLPVDPFPVDVAADTAIDGGTRLRHCPPLLRGRPYIDRGPSPSRTPLFTGGAQHTLVQRSVTSTSTATHLTYDVL
jgi:hypothetical protein